MKITIDQSMVAYFVETMSNEIQKESVQAGNNVKESLIKNGKVFLLENREDIERWTADMIQRRLTPSDYARLIRSQQDRIATYELERMGLAQEKINQLRQEIIKIILCSAFELAGGRIIRNPNNPQNFDMDS